MRVFTQKTRVQIAPERIETAREFARKVASTVNYTDSNQSDTRKIEDDHFISKIGEEAVRVVFEMFDLQVKGPDYRIYEGKQKSWDHDLYVDDIGLSVKTQKSSSAKKYGLSWTFQDSQIRRDPVLKDPWEWVCFVECDDLAGFGCLVYPPMQVGELVFREPKLPHLIGKKKVVYAEDLTKG
jgi:hypothetical protein